MGFLVFVLSAPIFGRYNKKELGLNPANLSPIHKLKPKNMFNEDSCPVPCSECGKWIDLDDASFIENDKGYCDSCYEEKERNDRIEELNYIIEDSESTLKEAMEEMAKLQGSNPCQ